MLRFYEAEGLLLPHRRERLPRLCTGRSGTSPHDPAARRRRAHGQGHA
ncbi:hypothetical protein ORIO_22555 (plasmid) [Cereibacter azotoformans]|nr:hypothetical protein [Cereibacter azotoformans]ULB12557.1 hypothetical protein ORIO_22555 [Cereibacter azotoformans]